MKTSFVCFAFAAMSAPAYSSEVRDIDICAAGLKAAMYMGSGIPANRFPTYIGTYKKGAKAVHRFRGVTNSRFIDACYLEQGRIIWRNERSYGGKEERWMTESGDEVYEYVVTDASVAIRIRHTDGTSSVETFQKNVLLSANAGKKESVRPIPVRMASPVYDAGPGGNCTNQDVAGIRKVLKRQNLRCSSIEQCFMLTTENIKVSCDGDRHQYRVLTNASGYYAERE